MYGYSVHGQIVDQTFVKEFEHLFFLLDLMSDDMSKRPDKNKTKI